MKCVLRGTSAEFSGTLTVSLDEGGSVIIGRMPGVACRINSPSVSREHARITLRGGRWLIEDLGSTGGTSIDGRPIEGAAELKNGREVALGDVLLRVEVEEAVEVPSAPEEPERDWIIPPPDQKDTLGRTLWDGDPAAVTPRAADDIVLSDWSGPIIVGRKGAENQVGLDNLLVSKKHACIEQRGQRVFVRDLGSTNGTHVNGRRLRSSPCPVDEGDEILIGPYAYWYDAAGRAFRSGRGATGGARIEVRDLGVQVIDREKKQPKDLLRGVNLVIEPGQFVMILGASGSGKSTLMGVMNGRSRPTSGCVTLDGRDLHSSFDTLKYEISYIPQSVIFHDMLTVEEALRYVSRLRMSKDVTKADIDRRIEEVLVTTGLAARRNVQIKMLSGGQKKRVSIAMELLTKPRIIFLDEVTSGLDPKSDREMMNLFREISRAGTTVVMITHHLGSARLADRVAYIDSARLCFYGDSEEFLQFFGVHDVEEAFDSQDLKDPHRLADRYAGSEICARRVTALLRDGDAGGGRTFRNRAPVPRDASPLASEDEEAANADHDELNVRENVRQFRVLTDRYVVLLKKDILQLGILVGLSVAIAFLVSLLTNTIGAPVTPVTPEEYAKYAKQQSILSFSAVMTMVFLSLFASLREIVKEDGIYRHERSSGLRLLPYFVSKFVVLGVLAVLQAGLVAVILKEFGDWKAGVLWEQITTLSTVALASLVLGLAISSAVPNSEWAATMLNGVVIPQILFSDVMVDIGGTMARVCRVLVIAFNGQDAITALLSEDVQKIVDKDTAAGGDSWLGGLSMVGFQMAAFALLACYFLARKDGAHGPAKFFSSLWRRFASSIPRRASP